MKLRFLKNLANEIGMYRQSYRKLHLTKAYKMNPNNVTEVRIPVPWGHVAGKWWGNTNEQPILALHGWQDNASSFDPLLELLPDSQPVLAIDNPGHGFSSHYPEGMLYHITSNVMVYRRIQKHFKWKNKLTVLGHSGGGVAGFLFTSIYPEFVNALIMLDIIKPMGAGNSFISKLGESIDTNVTKSRRDHGNNPKYSLEEIERRWLDATRGSLTSDAVKILMKRGVQLDHESGKYFLTRDPKVKLHSPYRFDENHLLEMAHNLDCHFLVVRCSAGRFLDYSLKNSPTFVSTVTEAAKSFKIVNIEGTHHAHLTHSETVAPAIQEFMQGNFY